MKSIAIALAAILTLPAGSALADGVVQKLMTPADKARLGNYDETRKAALAEAKGGSAAELAQLNALLAKPLLSTPDFDLGGEWRCRTTKVGGLSPLVVYGWFKCRVSDDGSGWKLEKTSGSQRTTGRFYDDGEKRLIYLGSFFIAGETANPTAAARNPTRSAMRSAPARRNGASNFLPPNTNPSSTSWNSSAEVVEFLGHSPHIVSVRSCHHGLTLRRQNEGDAGQTVRRGVCARV